MVGHLTLIRHAKTRGAASSRDAELFGMGIVGTAVVVSIVSGKSLAGLVAGALASVVLALLLRLPYARMFDAMFFALPFGWLFLRAGCALVHDHVGLQSASPLAVAFPDGPAFDLGVLELLATPFVAVLALLLARRELPPGALGGAIGCAYAVMRFVVAFASADSRYAALTVFQWVALAFGLAFAALFAGATTRAPSAF